ncbi:MAG: alpha/beta fold hydrolase, partial [Mycobacteriaceae bacterium]
MPPRFPRRSRRLLLVLAVVAALVAGVSVVAATRSSGPAPVAERNLMIPVPSAPGAKTTITLDATIYTPAVTPAPAVLLAHGFGGTKDSVAAQARTLAGDGFVVLAWSARGFGRSAGEIGINAPDGEVADARALVDYLATQKQVRLDAPGDPRVGVAGGSYGGALALSLAGTDPRIDADAAAITWNDLGQALLPDQAGPTAPAARTPAAGTTGADGVLKRSWAGIFFAAGASPTGVCGRFTPAVCQGYLAASVSGAPTPALLALLKAHSPVATNAGIKAPTLLLQGEADTLFGLDQADANAREIAKAGAPVRVSWFSGGHDAGGTNADADAQVADFLRFHLLGQGTDPGTGFRYEVAGSVSTRGTVRTRAVEAPRYPGLAGDPTPTTDLALTGGPQTIARPPGASPSAISTVPGIGAALGGLASSALTGLATFDVPGQVARFSTAPLAERLTVTGASRVALTVRAVGGGAAGAPAVLFAKLYDVSPDGTRTLPGGGVSAFRVPVGDQTTVQVTLPGIVHPVEAGHTLQLAVTTTDQAYAVPLTPAAYQVGLAGATLALPLVGGNDV